MYPLFAQNKAYSGSTVPGSARMKVSTRGDGAQVAFFEPTKSAKGEITGGIWLHQTEIATPELLNELYEQVIQALQKRSDRFASLSKPLLNLVVNNKQLNS